MFTISVTTKPVLGGVVAGAGTYPTESPVDLFAFPSPGYTFAGWVEGEFILSTSEVLPIRATAPRSIVAVFAADAASGAEVAEVAA